MSKTQHTKFSEAEIKRLAGLPEVRQVRDPRYPPLMLRFGRDRNRASWLAWLQEDLQQAIKAVDRKLKVDVGWLCRVAHVDFVVQYGETKYGKSTLLGRFNAGDRFGAPNEFLRWAYVDGKDCRLAESKCGGIMTRQQVRRELCMVGTP